MDLRTWGEAISIVGETFVKEKRFKPCEIQWENNATIFVPINHSFSGQRRGCGLVPGEGPQNTVEGGRRSECNSVLSRPLSNRLDTGMKEMKHRWYLGFTSRR